ncbi:hypothetical protein G6F57_000562 [Rhizopus arrhizus]|nr:hypothetical protein G6F21_000702 [Rhizopus arrhizus]KAG0820128.1 hypothetical protein G6F20_000205 [Rhizopus arrhizus]KAG0845220.1 hypothetical protein G6F18_001170 [Rhizopus arrhizus]KAG0861341.1 hypothetical protein G6F17_000175 [Rhizopus arrhizus]KAG0878121.1 hypothetical protein G6F16_001126 [Rhizopus arrhizus]
MIEGLTERGKVTLHAKGLGINPRTAMRWWKHYQETGKALKRKRTRAEAILSRSESNSVDLKKFVQYIKTRASVKNTLYEYYENETTKSKETYFPESEFDFRVDQKCNLYYGNLFIARIRGFSPQPENYSTDSSVKSQLKIQNRAKPSPLPTGKEAKRAMQWFAEVQEPLMS